jgi:hypothetical protein
MPGLPYHRIEVFLPSNPDFSTEILAVHAAEGWLKARFGGATTSTSAEAVFDGYYQSAGRWAHDKIVLIIVDTDESMESLMPALDVFHESLVGLYVAAGRAQDEFWITVTPMTRYIPPPPPASPS